MTSLVHSKEEADKAQEASRALFRGGVDSANMPTTELDSSKLVDGSIALDELMIEIGLAPTKSEVRRLVQQGGVSVNDSVADDCKMAITEADLRDGVTIKKGKKKFHKAIIK